MSQLIGIVIPTITNTMILVLLRGIISAVGIHLYIIQAVLLGVQLVAVRQLAILMITGVAMVAMLIGMILAGSETA